MINNDESVDLLELSVVENEEEASEEKNMKLRRHLLLPASHGHGVLKIEIMYLREQSTSDPDVHTLDVFLHNVHDEDKIRDISVRKKDVPEGMSFVPFNEIGTILPKSTIQTKMQVAFRGQENSIRFSVHSNLGSSRVELKAPLGELLRPVKLSSEEFLSLERKMSGLQEASCEVKATLRNVDVTVLEKLYVSVVLTKDEKTHRFAGKRMGKSSEILLFTVLSSNDGGPSRLRVNCENAVMGSVYLKVLKTCFES